MGVIKERQITHSMYELQYGNEALAELKIWGQYKNFVLYRAWAFFKGLFTMNVPKKSINIAVYTLPVFVFVCL